MKNKILNSILTYGFIIFLIVLLVDCIMKKYVVVPVLIIVDIIIFLPITRKLLLKLLGNDNDWIVYIPRIIITLLVFILLPLSAKVKFYHTFTSVDQRTTIIIEKKDITIIKNGKKEKYKYTYSMSNNREDYFIEVIPHEVMEHQYMLLRFNEKSNELCELEDGGCIEEYIMKK